ncbi:glycosyltransferase [Agromyces tropicus]|uniref:Glycosyltransferase n=2 Tax=Agromyces tropicus TaxID=555371 RepID=A0ABN2V3K4_9MICO
MVVGLAAAYVGVLVAKAALAGTAVARRRARVRAAADRPEPGRPPVEPADLTVVQPILSGDPQLEDALVATLVAAPRARVLWLVDEDDVEGRRVASAARSRHPLVDVEVVDCPPCPPAASPKAFKLALAETRITTAAFAVVDDDTRITADGVAALLDGLRVADVSTGLPCYVPGPGRWSRLLAAFVNDQAILAYLPTSASGSARALNGMTWAMRTRTLRRLGGFGPLTGLLADDLAIASRVRGAGGAIDQTDVPQFVSTSVADGRAYRRLMHRWLVFAGLAVRAEAAGWRIALVVAYALPSALLAGLVAGALARPGTVRAGAVVGALAARSAVIAAAQRTVTGRARHDPAHSLAAELALPVQFAAALAVPRITWRSRRYVVHANDRFEPVAR